ncbi:transmembrane protein, putative (macronuclear) [Tetrahymena thermophila SB210]|uniref:Transmembrane protein, putative n=1 Tax=Tetrahymena thermophila (strain SB210) TaxID=312017 RepID=W7XBY4_TETTS|nr:transmembrane protein, putative [Tetrahymena thermophila SB210]EWS74837.1 transmembrane protein, putative [Tetrahymena thermophila SB210]|eukprot:XP_012652550.1 transmembrane protein, putative [Tetrahymena thermophila SB210]
MQEQIIQTVLNQLQKHNYNNNYLTYSIHSAYQKYNFSINIIFCYLLLSNLTISHTTTDFVQDIDSLYFFHFIPINCNYLAYSTIGINQVQFQTFFSFHLIKTINKQISLNRLNFLLNQFFVFQSISLQQSKYKFCKESKKQSRSKSTKSYFYCLRFTNKTSTFTVYVIAICRRYYPAIVVKEYGRVTLYLKNQ